MKILSTVTTLTLFIAAGVAAAQPHIDDGGMIHVTLTYDGVNATAAVAPETVTLTNYPGEMYMGAASVLNETAYSSRFGFLLDGFTTFAPGEHLWIQRTGATAGLSVFEGGMRPMAMMHTYDPIFASDGDRIEYLGMHHPWFSTTVMGTHSMDFVAYVGDFAGVQINGTTADSFTLSFNAVPTPGSAALLGLGGLIASRRRR